MIFVMIYVSFDMILGAYLLGNMTALIVKGSKTVRFRDKMGELIKYMNRNKLGKSLNNAIKGHVLLQFQSSYAEVAALQDLPLAIRAKVGIKRRFRLKMNPCEGPSSLFLCFFFLGADIRKDI